MNQQCLSRQLELSGNQAGDYEAIMYDSHESMVMELMSGKVSM